MQSFKSFLNEEQRRGISKADMDVHKEFQKKLRKEEREERKKKKEIGDNEKIMTKPPTLKPDMTKIASSGNLKSLTKLINEFHFSTTFKINPDFTVSNKNGLIKGAGIAKKGKRFYYVRF